MATDDRTLEDRTLDHIEKLFGYRPVLDDSWCVYMGMLIVCRRDRQPVMYKHGGGGVAIAIEPVGDVAKVDPRF